MTNRGDAFEWQIPSTGDGAPDGYTRIENFRFRNDTLAHLAEDLMRAWLMLHRCTHWHECMHADLLDGKHASDLQLTVSADSTDGIDSPNLVAGTNITIAVSGSDITISAAGSGDISSGSNLTSGRVVKATGNKQIDTPIDLSMQYITVDAADDTVQLLAGPSKSIEIRSPDKIYFDVNGTNEMIVESGKVTIPGLLDPTGLELTPAAANPGGTAANTLWADSGAGNRFKIGTNTVAYLSEVGTGDLLAANNLSDLASDDTAIANLVDGATSRVPALTDTFPYKDAGDATGGKGTIQQIFDRIDDLNTASLGLSSPIAAFESGGKKTTPTAIYNLLNSLTAETAPAYNDKVALYDASASQTDAVTIANLLGSSRCVTIDYTGSGSSGKTVTLTGINRAHHLFIARNDASCNDATWWFAGGSTGTIRRIAFSSPTGGTGTECSLDAPAAGTSQVLTINATAAWINASGVSYRIFVVGTPT